MSKALIIQTPGTMTGSGGKKLENYVGIEFTRGASDGGGTNGYHKMIGDEELLSTLPLFNQIKLGMVKDATLTSYLNQTNINKTASGADVDLAGSDGSDVMQCYPDMYCILGGTDATYERFIFSDSYFEYGDDKAFKWNAFAQAPDREVIVNGKARSIYSTNLGSMGTTQATEISDGSFANAQGYPTSNTNRYGFETAAKSRNSNTASNKPYMNGTTLDMEVIMGILFVEMRTKDFTSVFGHGVSSNVFPTDANWDTTSGFKTTVDGVNKYFVFNSNVFKGGTLQNIWSLLCGGYYSLYKILEPQKLVSDGATLTPVYNSDGEALQGMGSGVMTGILKKTVTFKLSCAFASGDADAEHTFEMHLMIPIWRGATWMQGNVWSHLSGYDVVNYRNEGDTADHNMLYRAKTIESIVCDQDWADRDGQFNMESVYEQVCDLGSASGWTKNEISKNGISLAVTKDTGAAINNYQSAYLWVDNSNTTGKRRIKTAGRFGGRAYNGYCVPRTCDASNAPSDAYSSFASRFRCELKS